MVLNIFTDISEWFTKVTEPVKEFIIENTRNPILWVGIILVGLIIFEITYKALNKK